MALQNEWKRNNLTGGRLVLAKLEAIKHGYVKPNDGSFDTYLSDAMKLVRKYVAISDITRNPGGVDEPGSITVENILNENAEVWMQDDGWRLETYRTPEEIAKIRAEMEAEENDDDDGDE